MSRDVLAHMDKNNDNRAMQGQDLDELHDSSGGDKCQDGGKATVAPVDLHVLLTCPQDLEIRV